MNIYWDIETAPLPDAVERIKKLKPFDPDAVKCGNLKDPAKIAEKIATAEIEHYDGLLERAALDPRFSYICAVGVQIDEDTRTFMDGEGDEQALIEWLWQQLSINDGYHKCAGWNNHRFDLPFLIKRTWFHRMKVPTGHVGERGFLGIHVDLMKVWCAHIHNEFAGLKATAEFLGVNRPREHGVEGKDFYKVLKQDRAKALAYLTDDLLETQAIGEIIL